MEYRQLGKSDIRVSVICLGSMTWGQQNSEAEAHQQLDFALESGINFIDTAEMYPVPINAETQGRTEKYIGSWMKARNNRQRLIIATKVSGKADWAAHIRDGKACLDRDNIRQAVESSLQRLDTDYIDLYQTHWPDRKTNFFGQLGYSQEDEAETTAIEETLSALHELVVEGKIRMIGISNETPWGVMQYLQAAERLGISRIVSIQNPYSLLNRSFEIGLAEMAIREQVGLLPYSPLGFGVLSGKYLNQQMPDNARLKLFPQFARYTNPEGVNATQAYVEIAQQAGLDPAQMALAYVNSRPFVTSNIIGATSMKQLENNIASADLTLSADVLEKIEAVHVRQPNPCP